MLHQLFRRCKASNNLIDNLLEQNKHEGSTYCYSLMLLSAENKGYSIKRNKW